MTNVRISPCAAILALALAFAAGPSSQASEPAPAAASAPQNAHVTLYRNGLGIIDETRKTDLSASGPVRLILSGIAPAAIDGSAIVDAEGLSVDRLVYRLQPLSLDLLLRNAVGTTVERVRVHPQTGAESHEPVTLLAFDGGRALIKSGGRVETVSPAVLSVPAPAMAQLQRPAIDLDGQVGTTGLRTLHLRYLTGNVGWQTDYVIATSGSETTPRLDVTGWARITNASGRAFIARPLTLVAGEINRTSQPKATVRSDAIQPRMMVMAADAAPLPERTSGGDVHLYTLAGPVPLAEGDTTQVRLLHQSGIKAERRYVLQGAAFRFRSPVPGAQPVEHPAVEVSFENKGKEPLPAGNARVYAGDRLLGESAIPATPSGEQVEIRTGRAFDVTARRTQTAFSRLGPPDNAVETSHRVEFRNAGDTAATIEVVEPIGGEWNMVEASRSMTRDGLNATWRIDVPAGGKTTLTYTVRVSR